MCALVASLALASCNGADNAGPDPIPPRLFNLALVDNASLPHFLWREPIFGGEWYLEAARLVPYAVGRTIDQRLVNDRTGRGGTGGNTRDTTVARGQFMDIRTIREFVNDGSGRIVLSIDSTLVDAEVRDTVLIITRVQPNKTISAVDTGHFIGDQLVLKTTIDYRTKYGMPLMSKILTYQLSR